MAAVLNAPEPEPDIPRNYSWGYESQRKRIRILIYVFRKGRLLQGYWKFLVLASYKNNRDLSSRPSFTNFNPTLILIKLGNKKYDRTKLSNTYL